MEVVRGGHPDPTAFDRGHRHYDAGSDPPIRAGTRSRSGCSQVCAAGHTGGAAQAFDGPLAGPDRVASWQPPVGHAGHRRRMEIHSPTRRDAAGVTCAPRGKTGRSERCRKFVLSRSGCSRDSSHAKRSHTIAMRQIDHFWCGCARSPYPLLAIPSTMYILRPRINPTWRSIMATKKKAKKKASKKK